MRTTHPLVPFLVFALAAATVAQQKEPAPAPAPAAGQMGWTGVLGEKEFAALHDLKTEAAPKPKGEMVQVGDQRHYLSLPEGKPGPHPAVLVIHEWWGLNDHIKHWADRLAADGYAALAVDLYKGANATTREEAQAAMRGVDAAQAKATLLAAHRFLADEPRVRATKRASIGWCFGGGWSLQLALAAPDLDAAVIYYGRLVDDVEQLKAIRAPVLGVFGTRDRSYPKEVLDGFEKAMADAGRSLRLLRYDADHAFANPSGQRYDAANAAAAWVEVRQFLDRQLKGATDDGATPDRVLDALYATISGPASQARDAQRLRNLFHAEARMVPVARASDGTMKPMLLTVDRYVSHSLPMLERNGFYEQETGRKTQVFGDLAHALSTYECRRALTDEKPFLRGVNSLQMVREGGRWRILQIVWEQEADGGMIPTDLLK